MKAYQRPRHSLRARSTDPSETKSLRRAYGRRLRSGFDDISTIMRESVVEDDIFELTALEHPGPYDFEQDSRKVDAFIEWLEDAQEQEVLELISENDNRYVRKAYESGVETAHGHLRDAGVDIDETDVERLINQPVHQSKLQQIYTRNYELLEGISSDVADEVRDELTTALAEGTNPRETGRAIADRIDKIGKTRATTLARTETLHSHNQASIERYRSVLGEEADVTVEAELLTAQDDRVCPKCEPRHGQVMSLDEAESNGPPFHPNCRCVVTPTYSN